jgi:hypothetical protein
MKLMKSKIINFKFIKIRQEKYVLKEEQELERKVRETKDEISRGSCVLYNEGNFISRQWCNGGACEVLMEAKLSSSIAGERSIKM